MPVYEYLCKQCNAIDEIQRDADRRDNPYRCPECRNVCERKLTKPNVITKGLEIPYMHPAFGVVMTDSQAKAEAKRRGCIEVGNEDVTKHTDPPKPQNYEAEDYFL